MMGNSRMNEKGKAPASANSNTHPPSGLTFLEGSVDEYAFESLLDMSLTFAEPEDFHRSVAQGIPETGASPRGYSTNLNSSNAINRNFDGVSLLPDSNMSWGQQCANQGHNATSAGGIGNIGRESSIASFNRPQVNRDITGLSFLLHSRESAPVHTQNNASFNQSQSGIQGNLGGDFLSLRLGGSKESVSRSHLGGKEISDQLKEAASNELKMARVRNATGQTLGQASGPGFTGYQSNNSGFSNQYCHEDRMTSTNNEVGFHGSLNSWPDSSQQHILHMQQNDMKRDKNIRSGDLDYFSAEKLREVVSTELKMRAQKAMGQTSSQSLNASFMSFQSNTSGFSNHFSNVDRMTSIKNEVGVLGTLNSGVGTSPHHILQMQQNDSRNIRYRDLNQYRASVGNQPVHSGTIGGNSAHVFNSQHHNLNKPLEFEKPLQLESDYTPFEQLEHMRSTTANAPNHAGHVISQNATPSLLLGVRSTKFHQRTAAPQVSRVDTGPAGIDEPFPKRLGIECNVSRQSNQKRLSLTGSSFQTANTGQVSQYPDKGLTHLTDHVLRPTVGRPDAAPVSYPISSQEPIFAHGQSQNALIQLTKGPQGATSTNASNVVGQSPKPNLHIRSHHKRSAAVPHPAPHWVQRQKITHPTVHHSRPKPSIPVTTAQVLPSIPVALRTPPADPVAARIRPVIPSASIVKPRVPVTTAPAVSHIIPKVPEATPKLSGYKCFLCKRDLALTSEGAVYRPPVPPPVAILPCGHSFHDQCLQNITPDDQAKDPPCIPCAIGEQ